MRKSRLGRASALLAKSICLGVVATAAFSASYSEIAYQDIASLTGKHTEKRWLAHLPQVAGNSIKAAAFSLGEKPGVDLVMTSSISAGMQMAVSTTPKVERQPQKILRATKGGRVVSATAVQAPKNFSAGSILEKHSLLSEPVTSKKMELAFVKPKPNQQAYKVASAFHLNKPAVPKITTPKGLPIMVASLVKESRSSVLSYAPEPKLERSPFAAVLNEPKPATITPKLGKGDHSWVANPLPKSSFSNRQQKCLAQGIYFEARGESVRGQAAVSQVILNRVRNPSYPNSICGVVYQNKHWRNRCQFSFACDSIRDRVRDQKSWKIAKHVAAETTAGRIWFPQVGSSTHYHATYVRPKWARHMKRVGKVGLHIFYRTKRGGWS